MGSQDPVEVYEALLSSSVFLFIVYYRGHWCPFCTTYLATLQTLATEISFHGGKAVVITSEPEEHLPATRKSSGYEGEAIVDPENKIVSYFKEKDMVHVTVSNRNYEFGMAQPAILAVRKDESVLEKWAIVPSVMNIGGAKDRPDLRQVWENVKAKLGGNEGVHGEFRTIGAWDLIKAAIFG